jgi:enoyl-CoA hydratase
MSTNTVRRYGEGLVAVLQIERPEVRNAIDIATVKLLGQLVRDAIDDPSIRVIVIRGSGEKAFSAGGDLREMINFTPLQSDQSMMSWQDTLAIIERSPKPVIAAIRGYALGGGTELAMACHLRVAADDAKLGQPEIALDHLPGAGGTQRLPRLIPLGIAYEYLLTGDPIPISEAFRLGLVNHVWPANEFDDRVAVFAARIAERSPVAVRATLEAIWEARTAPLDSGLRTERALASLVLESAEAQKGLESFTNRKKLESITNRKKTSSA